MASSELDLGDARRAILNQIAPLAAEEVALERALGRVLAEEVVAGAPLPPFDSSAMDGFAIRAADLIDAGPERPVPLTLVGESRAGHPSGASLEAGQAIAISTGAVIPGGADAVVRVELTRQADAAVEVLAPVAPGTDVRRAGDDVRAGSLVLAAGSRLGPAELGMLASLGRMAARCHTRPRVAVLVTGDELAPRGAALAPGAIHDSNSLSLAALVRLCGAELVRAEQAGDVPEDTRSAIERALGACDALIVCGGVSVGDHDHVRPSLLALGVREVFWGLAVKPGHPTWFGLAGTRPVFGLPGNPVSAMVTFQLLAAPALKALEGERPAGRRLRARLRGGYDKPAGRAHAVRCRLSDSDGVLVAEQTGAQGSHILSSMADADCLALIAADTSSVADGELVEIQPLLGLGSLL